MKIDRFAIETFTGFAADEVEEGEVSTAGEPIIDFTPTGTGFGAITRVFSPSIFFDDLHNNIYMTSSINSQEGSFVYSGSLSAPGDSNDGVFVSAHGIFISETR